MAPRGRKDVEKKASVASYGKIPKKGGNEFLFFASIWGNRRVKDTD